MVQGGIMMRWLRVRCKDVSQSTSATTCAKFHAKQSKVHQAVALRFRIGASSGKESSGAMQSQRSRSSTNCVMNRADQFWLSATQEVAFYAGARLSSFLTSLSTKPFNCSPKGQLRSPESRNPQVQTVLCTPRKGNKSTKRGPAF